MKNIEKGSIKHLILLILLTSILGIILYPLFDWLVSLIFTHSEFIYSTTYHIFEPIMFGTTLGVILWIIEKKK